MDTRYRAAAAVRRLVLSDMGQHAAQSGAHPAPVRAKTAGFHGLYAYTGHKRAGRTASAPRGARPLHRVADRYAGVDEHGNPVLPRGRGNVRVHVCGAPQGGIISPILASLIEPFFIKTVSPGLIVGSIDSVGT